VISISAGVRGIVAFDIVVPVVSGDKFENCLSDLVVLLLLLLLLPLCVDTVDGFGVLMIPLMKLSMVRRVPRLSSPSLGEYVFVLSPVLFVPNSYIAVFLHFVSIFIR